MGLLPFSSSTLPGGTNGQLQYNDSGVFGGTNSTYVKANGTFVFKPVSDTGAAFDFQRQDSTSVLKIDNINSRIFFNSTPVPTGTQDIGATSTYRWNTIYGTNGNFTGYINVPKIYPSADSTTAFQINKANGTTNILNIDTTNSRIGIGTTSPAVALHVYNASGEGTMLSRSGVNSSYCGLLMRDYNDSNAASFQYGNPSASAFANTFFIASRQATIPIAIYQGGTAAGNERIRIDASANIALLNSTVTIGGTSPIYAGRKLSIEGADNAAQVVVKDTTSGTIITLSASTASGAKPYMGTISAQPFYFVTNNSYRWGAGANGGFSVGSTFYSTDPGSGKMIIENNVGIGTTAPDKKVEINTGAGTDGIRISYNDANGSAATYADFLVDSGGDLEITATGGDISFGNENLATTGAVKGVHKAADGTAAVADGTYTTGIGGTTNGTITIKDGIITAIQEAVA